MGELMNVEGRRGGELRTRENGRKQERIATPGARAARSFSLRVLTPLFVVSKRFRHYNLF